MQTARYSKQTPPVLLIAFNRPQLTERMLDRIKTARPSVLYVACDGPRPDRQDDQEKISRIHAMVAEIDWCDTVKTLFRPANLGCGPGVSEAISWFLNDAGEGIILEDDTLPDPTFFRFCGDMLDRYRETTNIWQVSGYTPLTSGFEMESDYLFSQCAFSWGWATWLRAWNLFDYEMKSWPEFKKLGYQMLFPFTPVSVAIFEDTYNRRMKTGWNYQWNYARAANSGLTVLSKISLVENIGYGPDATHTTSLKGAEMFMAPARPMSFPIKHPKFIYADNYYDRMLVRAVERRGLRIRIMRVGSALARRYRWVKFIREWFRPK